jgi:hypothetical protein
MSNNAGGALRRKQGLVALVLSLAAPLALAGPKEDTEQAEKEFARGNLVLSMALWKKAAEAGYAPAQARYGDILDKAEEDAQAVAWFRKAAAQGNAAGEYGLGDMYAKGEGVKQDFEQARSYITRAAEKGHLPAVLTMREMYKNGSMGVKADPVKSAEWDAKVKDIVSRDKAQAAPAAQAAQAKSEKK